MRHGDSQTATHVPSALPGTPEYKTRVAEPTMQAIDNLSAEYRLLVHELGYVDVYRAYMRRWSPEKIRDIAARTGTFKL